MRSPAFILSQCLQQQGILVPSWTMFVSFMPQVLDTSLCLFDTAGKSDHRIMDTGERITHPGIQVQVRAADYQTAWGKANDIAILVDSLRNYQVEFSSDEVYTLLNVSRHGDIIPVGIETADQRRLHLVTINMTATIESATALGEIVTVSLSSSAPDPNVAGVYPEDRSQGAEYYQDPVINPYNRWSWSVQAQQWIPFSQQ